MSRPRKRTRHRASPHAADGLAASPTTPSDASVPTEIVTSRIERKGLDLELVATRVPGSGEKSADERRRDGPEGHADALRADASRSDAMLAAALLSAHDAAAAADLEAEAEAELAAAIEADTSARLQSEALRAELTQIGVVLDLPAKRVNRPTATSNAAVRGSGPSAARLSQWLAGAIVFTGVGIAAAMLRTAPAPTLPPALLGEWATSNPAYQGRQLAFVESQIVMRVAADAPLTRHPIVAMTSRTVADTTMLGLTYSTEDGEVELHARLVGRDKPRLVFERPTGLVWERRVE